MREKIAFIEKELVALKAERRQTTKHIAFEELPEEERFYRIAPARKQLFDTIKMIGYRVEKAMVQILR